MNISDDGHTIRRINPDLTAEKQSAPDPLGFKTPYALAQDIKINAAKMAEHRQILNEKTAKLSPIFEPHGVALPDPYRQEPFAPVCHGGEKAFLPPLMCDDHGWTGDLPKDWKSVKLSVMRGWTRGDRVSGWFHLVPDGKGGASKMPIRSQGSRDTQGSIQGVMNDTDKLAKIFETYTDKASLMLGTRIPETGASSEISADSAGFDCKTPFFVIDLDLKHGKEAAITVPKFLADHGFDLSKFAWIQSPSGGLHLPLIYDDDIASIGMSNVSDIMIDTFGKGVDLRVPGGIVILPGVPFISPDGRLLQYQVINNRPLQPCPDCLRDLLIKHYAAKAKKNPVGAQLENSGAPVTASDLDDPEKRIALCCQIMEAAKEGSRNQTLNNVSLWCGQAVAAGKIDRETVEDRLSAAAAKTGLGENEIFHTMASGLDAGELKGGLNDFNWAKHFNIKLAPPAPEKKRPDPLGFKPDQTPAFPEEEAVLDEEPNPNSFFDRYHPGALGRFGMAGLGLKEEDLPYQKRVDRAMRAAGKIFLPPEMHEAIEALVGDYYDYGSMAQTWALLSASVLGGRRRADIGEDVCEPSNLLTMIIGEPGGGKSYITRKILGGVRKFQARKMLEYQRALEQYKIARKEWEKEKSKGKSDPPKKPVRATYCTTDTTPEALAECCHYNPGGVLCFYDEGKGGVDSMGRYNKAGGQTEARKILIEGYNGGSILVNRKNQNGEDGSRFATSANISACFCIQYGLAASLFSSEDIAQGFEQRFLVVLVPPLPEGERPLIVKERNPDKKKSQRFIDDTVMKLLELLPPPPTEELEPPQAVEIPFSRDAIEIIGAWQTRLERQCRYGNLKIYVTRAFEHLCRLSLAMHYLHWAAAQARSIDENGEGTGAAVPFADTQIETIDVQRAIALMNICLLRRDQWLWLRDRDRNPDHEPSESSLVLDKEQEKFTTFYYKNTKFFATPRSAEEIMGRGYKTDKTPRQLLYWLKKQGFQDISSKKAQTKFVISGLEPWKMARNLQRNVFDRGDNIIDYAHVIISHWQEASDMEFKVPRKTFAKWFGYDDEDDMDQLVDGVLHCQEFLLAGYEGNVLFRQETFDVCQKICSDALR